MKLLEKIFGTYSSREIKKIEPIVDKIESIEEEYKKLSDEELRAKTQEFKDRLKNGETLDDILPEAYATVAEASSRVLGMRHFRVQLIGGIIIHQGRIAEMKTGEGKTLVATLPVYLNALTGKGVHVVTVNEYLAKRDSLWMGKLYNFLGLTVGLVVPDANPVEGREAYLEEKKKAYNADITYLTSSELAFDYLRDNMAITKEAMVQRGLNFAIVDEIDSILIDECRNPLIISGSKEVKRDLYKKANAFAKTLKAKQIVEKDNKVFDEKDDEYDYIVDLKAKTVALTNTGTQKAEKYFGIDSLSDISNMDISHHVNEAIRAYGLMRRDKDYIVKDDKVLIIDENTGRIMDGRRYSDGLHQAIEAKEGVTIADESQTIAVITFQNFFRLYDKLAGMTGTAKTEEEEFKGIYKLDIVEIPTNKPVQRIDQNDILYKTEKAKFNAIVADIEACYQKGQPVLVGTASIEKSELLDSMLNKKKIPHNVLNAKFHEKEAEIIAQAGKYKAVTIATNMAGRGTDITLGGNLDFIVRTELAKRGFTDEEIELARTPIPSDNPRVNEAKEEAKIIEDENRDEIKEEKKKVIEAGGLKIIGSERHESRRIDNQLRGRAGRQGDPGESCFYISFDDDLMKLFGADKMQGITDAMLPDNVPIQRGIFNSTVETAQRRYEGRNYTIRKTVLEYDDVMNQQREIIYSQRKEVLESDDVRDIVKKLYVTKLREIANEYFGTVETAEDVDYGALNVLLMNLFYEKDMLNKEDVTSMELDDIVEMLTKKVDDIYQKRLDEFKAENIEDAHKDISKFLILTTVNEKWQDHIDAMTDLKDGIGLRAYAQTNPIDAYKMEAYSMFEELTALIREESIKKIFALRPKKKEDILRIKMKNDIIRMIASNGGEMPKRQPAKATKKVGRNEPCPCGSGKKYKNCCGRNE